MDRRRGCIPRREIDIDAFHTGNHCKTPLRANHYQSVHTSSTQTKLKCKGNHRRCKEHPRVAGQNYRPRIKEILTLHYFFFTKKDRKKSMQLISFNRAPNRATKWVHSYERNKKQKKKPVTTLHTALVKSIRFPLTRASV